MQIKENFKKFVEKIKNILKFDENDKKALLMWFADLVVFGLMLNTSLTIMGLVNFTWYSWICWGSVVAFIERKFIPWIRRLWIK